ncbi:DUF397 domain-containing protein [Streptomyces sp. NPDC059382]|uniref:DUF397 domain-containing protein n=1 Tax=Streptomyces sp. NPDC059382 TaxID=3346816 RepID=UPI0036BCAC92
MEMQTWRDGRVKATDATEAIRAALAPLGLPESGGNTHPDGEACVTLAKIGPDAWALGDSKRPDAEPLRFTTAELDAAGVDPARFDLSA